MSTEITPALRFPRMEPPTRGSAAGDAAAARRGGGSGEKQVNLDAAVRDAAKQLFADRNVDVRGFHDPAADRMVYRVVDTRSGEVLFQSPPDQLLRFYAMSRGLENRPLLRVDI